MTPAKVIGRVVAAQALEAFRGVKFLIVQPIDAASRDAGPPFVACDAIGANLGERVYTVPGREATFPLPHPFNPADATIVAIIDEMEP